MHEPFFFGPSGRQLFATYHPPIKGDGRVLTVICPPLFVEYMRTWPALRKLAIALSERGQHVLRFDYRGTGDSFGDIEGVAVSDWLEDIALVVKEGRELSGSNVVRLVGVRAGAALACRSVGSAWYVQRVVLWDPVADGIGYLELQHQHRLAKLERNFYLDRAARREAINEYAGYRFSDRMKKELKLLDASAYSNVSIDKLHIINTESGNIFPIEGIARYLTPFACQWNTDSEVMLVPALILEQLIACLTID